MIPLYTLFETKKESCPLIKQKFLIHKHNANRAGLHYDLRIEHNCMLLSWATRKMPELISGTTSKIALFEQPVHDPSWFDFEGDIDDGYGAGKVLIWDKGSYDIIKWGDHLILDFHGNRLKGIYVLLPYPMQDNQWLMFRKKI